MPRSKKVLMEMSWALYIALGMLFFWHTFSLTFSYIDAVLIVATAGLYAVMRLSGIPLLSWSAGVGFAALFAFSLYRWAGSLPHLLSGMFSGYPQEFNEPGENSPDVAAFPEFKMLSFVGVIALLMAGLFLLYVGRLRQLDERVRDIVEDPEVLRKRSELERILDERRRKEQ